MSKNGNDIKALDRVIDLVEETDLWQREDKLDTLIALWRLRNYELAKKPAKSSKDSQLKHPM